MKRKNISSRLILAITLIAFGVVLLLSNIGLITGGVWNNLLRLWPALLIAAGFASLVQQRDILGPTITITLGTSLLLGNFNLISPLAWGVLISLWPLLLVAGGLDVINHRRSILAAAASTAVLVALTFGIYWYTGAFTFSPGRVQQVENLEASMGEIEDAEINLLPGVGYLEIRGGAESGTLVSGTVPEEGGEPAGVVTYRESSGTGFFRYSQTDERSAFPWTAGQQFYSFTLSGDVPVELEVSIGVGFELIDLTRLAPDSFSSSSGMGIAEIILPEEGEFTGEIDVGIGQTTITAPPGLPLRILLETGLVIATVPEGYLNREGVITSPGFSPGEAHVELTINQAMGLVRIEESE
ncbi:MAG TPA: DUF5668 domain-containing protein [Anaerolineales bacterium]|nr:DUF5668 domain-containing protein [Anaerolineales bacterium]